MSVEKVRLDSLKNGDKFILSRSGNKYLFKEKIDAYKSHVKPINHTVGLKNINGEFLNKPTFLSNQSLVIKL